MSKTIIVTGASRGIGKAVAEYLLLASENHNVVVVARSADLLQQLEEKYGKRVKVVSGDLGTLSLAQEAVKAATEGFGQLDGMVLNHGCLGQISEIGTVDLDQWKKAFDVNFFSMVVFTQAALPALRTTKGKIVFTSSQAAVLGFPNWGIYSATKAAANSLARNIANEEKDITSVCIDPGLVDTSMQRELREDHAKTLTPEMHALLTGVHDDGGLSRPEQPGHVMAKLVLDAPSELSGQFITWNDQTSLASFQD